MVQVRGFVQTNQFHDATAVQPFVKLDGASAHICVRRSGHFKIPRLGQNLLAFLGFCHQMATPRLIRRRRVNLFALSPSIPQFSQVIETNNGTTRQKVPSGVSRSRTPHTIYPSAAHFGPDG